MQHEIVIMQNIPIHTTFFLLITYNGANYKINLKRQMLFYTCLILESFRRESIIIINYNNDNK